MPSRRDIIGRRRVAAAKRRLMQTKPPPPKKKQEIFSKHNIPSVLLTPVLTPRSLSESRSPRAPESPQPPRSSPKARKTTSARHQKVKGQSPRPQSARKSSAAKTPSVFNRLYADSKRPKSAVARPKSAVPRPRVAVTASSSSSRPVRRAPRSASPTVGATPAKAWQSTPQPPPSSRRTRPMSARPSSRGTRHARARTWDVTTPAPASRPSQSHTPASQAKATERLVRQTEAARQRQQAVARSRGLIEDEPEEPTVKRSMEEIRQVAERLYRDAERHARWLESKREQAQAQLTFQPTTTNNSRSGKAKGGLEPFLRMYDDAMEQQRRREAREAAAVRDLQEKQCFKSPRVPKYLRSKPRPSGSTSSEDSQSDGPVRKLTKERLKKFKARLEQYAQNKAERQREMAEKQRVEHEEAECTFHPNLYVSFIPNFNVQPEGTVVDRMEADIEERRERLREKRTQPRVGPVVDSATLSHMVSRMSQDSRRRIAKREELARSLDDECTFQPQINHKVRVNVEAPLVERMQADVAERQAKRDRLAEKKKEAVPAYVQLEVPAEEMLPRHRDLVHEQELRLMRSSVRFRHQMQMQAVRRDLELDEPAPLWR